MRDCGARARSLSEEVRWLRFAVDGAQAQNAALKAKLAKRIAEKNTPSRPIAGVQLRTALRRSRRQKETIKSQSLEIRRLRRAVRVGSSSRFKLRAARTAVEVSVGPGRGTAQGAAEIATPEGHHQVAARGPPGCAGARRRRGTGSRRFAKLRATGAVLSRTLYGHAAHRAPARPAAWRPRAWPHPAARARGTHRRAQSAR